MYLYRENPDSASRAVFSDKFFDILRVADLKYKTIQKDFPNLIKLANNMQLKAKMNLLKLLALRTSIEYYKLERTLLAWVQENQGFYISAIDSDDKWMFILKNHLYFVYKVIKHL